MRKTILFLALLLCTGMISAQQLEQINPTTVQLKTQNGQMLYMDFYGPNIIRVFQDPDGGIIRDPQCDPQAQILVDNPRRNVTLGVDGNILKTSQMEVEVNAQTGQLTIRHDGRTVLEQTAATQFDKSRTSISFRQGPTDYFYGGGCQNGRFSHRGQTIEILNTNNWVDGGVASPAPYFWSTAGYGVMWYTFAPGHYDFGKKDSQTTTLSHESTYLDLFIMVDDGATALLDDYYQLTGNPVLLPKFGFYEGHLNAYNRDYWTEKENGFMAMEDGKRYSESQKDNGGIRESLNGEKDNYQFSARAAIDRYLDNDMPLGWFLPNDGYGAGYGQDSTLEGNIQNLKEFGQYARQKGVEIGLWTQSDLHPKEGVEALLQRDIVREVRDAGVRVLKTDVAWVGAGYSFGLNGVADVAHVMPYYGQNARPFIISLDGWAGTQRYAGIWTGDQTGGEWEYIRFHIPTYIGCGLSGQPNVTSDMDGIFGGKNLPVNVRDFQWKTFTPMQLNMDGWGMNPKYPQALGDSAASINRNYLKLKSMLMPYTYSIAHEAVDGLPMMRAMFLEDENAYTLGVRTQYQFMYGPSILVAPIYKETRADKQGNDVRDGIYLPQGTWVDAYDGRTYQGGRIINDYAAPLWRLPVFLKQGAIIPVTEAHNTPLQRRDDLLQLLIVPGPRTTFSLYDDDGRTEAYRQGASQTTQIQSELDSKGRLRVTINPAVGSYDGMVAQKHISLTIPATSQNAKVTARVDGHRVKATLQTAQQTSLFAQNMPSISGIPTQNTLQIELADPVDLTRHGVTILVSGIQPSQPAIELTQHGALQTPRVTISPDAAYSLTPQWEAVQNADYYEIQFDGQLYSTIRQTQYTIDNLTPVTDYTIQVRAVNADGQSDWMAVQATTTNDPLEHAIHGAKGECDAASQGGQGIRHLFDFDLTTTWHTKWGEKAVPFELTVDLHSVNTLDKMQYVPRPDAGNGTLLKGTVSVSLDRINWTDAGSFDWQRNGEVKEMKLPAVKARFVRLNVTEGAGGFGSGQQLYIFRQPGSDWFIPGDINQDGRLDENDLTSYLNYTGLREGDSDFGGYISRGDLNANGLIDAYDISAVATEWEDGVTSREIPTVEGSVVMQADKQQYKEGETVTLTLSGKGLRSVNALSLAIPYDATEMEYVGVEPIGLPDMYNMTYDRLHSNGQKALYPTFVNLGEQKYIEGDVELMKITFRAKKNVRLNLQMRDGILVDKAMNSVTF